MRKAFPHRFLRDARVSEGDLSKLLPSAHRPRNRKTPSCNRAPSPPTPPLHKRPFTARRLLPRGPESDEGVVDDVESSSDSSIRYLFTFRTGESPSRCPGRLEDGYRVKTSPQQFSLATELPSGHLYIDPDQLRASTLTCCQEESQWHGRPLISIQRSQRLKSLQRSKGP